MTLFVWSVQQFARYNLRVCFGDGKDNLCVSHPTVTENAGFTSQSPKQRQLTLLETLQRKCSFPVLHLGVHGGFTIILRSRLSEEREASKPDLPSSDPTPSEPLPPDLIRTRF